MLDQGAGGTSASASSQAAGIPYKAVFIWGSNLVIPEDLRQQFNQKEKGFLLIGDGTTQFAELDCSALRGAISENTRIYISAHGGFKGGNVYLVDHMPASELLKKLAVYNPTMPLNIEFYACKSGTAAPFVAELPIGSVLVTHGGADDATMADLNFKTIRGSSIDLISHTDQVRDFTSRFALHVKQTATISIKKQDGSVFQCTIRPPRGVLTKSKRVIDYLQEERQRFIDAYNQEFAVKIDPKDPKSVPIITEEDAVEWRNDYFHYMLRSDNDKLLEALNTTPDKFTSFVNCLSEGLTPLIIVIGLNKVEQVTALLKVPGIDINGKNKNGVSALLLAASMQNFQIIELLKGVEGINPNIKDSNGYTILMLAVLNAEVKLVNALNGFRNIDSNEKNSKGDTLLMLAASREYTRIIEELKNFPGIDPNIRDSSGNTVLMLAVINRRLRVIEALKNFRDIDSNAKDSNGNTALMLAAANKHINVIEALKNFPGIDPNAKDNNGKTVLMLAAAKEHIDVLNALKNFPDINPNAKDNDGKTVLMLATESGSIKVIEALKNFQGIDPNAKDNEGNTVLMLAAAKGDIEVINALKSFPGFVPEAEDLTAVFIFAAGNGSIETIKVIMDFPGFVPTAEVMNKAFMHAVQRGNSRAIKEFKNFTDIAPSAENLNAALILAAGKGDAEVVKSILGYPDFVPNSEAIRAAKDNNHNNVGLEILMWAAGNGHSEVINVLKEGFPGFNPNATYIDRDNLSSYTAFELAASNNHSKVIKALKEFPGFAPDAFSSYAAFESAANNGHSEVIKALKDFPGFTPDADDLSKSLVAASSNGHVEVIKALKDFPGIDPNVEDENGETALICAAKKEDTETLKQLLKCFPEIEVPEPETLPYGVSSEAKDILESFENNREKWLRDNGVEDADEQTVKIHAKESLKTQPPSPKTQPSSPRASYVESLGDRPAVIHTVPQSPTSHSEAVKVAPKDPGLVH